MPLKIINVINVSHTIYISWKCVPDTLSLCWVSGYVYVGRVYDYVVMQLLLRAKSESGG